ncbi:hypothetical protein [Thalassovita sp.]|uniref:hypothetical protein n=1 Tax=Thalassovita sp. TaxID=1979401 RepID=UPI0029DE5A03|nr:hypothetical protein [Thalassovita sp.]
MRHSLLITSAILFLAGCVPVDVYHKAGGSLHRLQNDETDCKVSALQQVPVNRMTRITPIRLIPQQHCERRGDCRIVYIEVGGNVETYDANLPLRQRVEAQCMARKGYERVELPVCTEKAPATLPGTMPPLAEKACAVRTKTGYRAVNPG